ncbi:bifunctional protein GlmU [Iodidimonas nitroreducens]|uniref:Bifunctional protein GlmU n=1 Tax=Iodidimonas nitroreducens TaxID=1236968 RepID=A0A5A7N6Q1_9PROT|nr:bifunctional UDP-N-acetylglucosamine diphosphorylase/glucosamine-1-phosphate N-acetyltransferase GlmU [Iodidimonas nitroreducens]GAK32143.1 bifunctional protein GlmU [alpha proteobacterium Q-1]GER02706.1 bifunctional protein GlmU [Iodidimonas nitroreducens]
MSVRNAAAVILAAGKGTRMKSRRHKVLHPIGGRAMIDHIFDRLADISVARQILVVGSDRQQLEAAMAGRKVDFAVQEPQLGTGHAVMQALPALAGHQGPVLVLYGDTPLIRSETLALMLAQIGDRKSAGPGLVVLGFRPEDPGAYGRLVTDDDGNLLRIVEYKDASPAERAIGLCNSGVMAFDGALLPRLLQPLRNDNAKGEYYLTDTVAIARDLGVKAAVIEAPADDLLGVNDRADLAMAEAVFQKRMRRAAMAAGATLIAPDTVYFSHDTKLGRDVLIEPQVIFGPHVEIEDDAIIRAFSHIEGAKIATKAVVGPYARLRPGADIGKGVKIGNFVEIKNARLDEGAKASHLSYIGDATIGPRVNIGAGTIFCNYDGFAKFHTSIGADSFIGSNSALVAPLHIGEGAIIGAGSVISRAVDDGDLALARAEQTSRPGWAKKFRARKSRPKSAPKIDHDDHKSR